MLGNIYTIHETSQPLCPHTHCIDNITCILGMTSHSPYMWHHLHYARHHILTLSPQTTVFMSSQPLYLTSCPLCLCHHIHCIVDITYTEFMTSDVLSMTSYPIFRTSHHFMYDIKSTVSVHTSTASVLTSTASVSSHPTYR